MIKRAAGIFALTTLGLALAAPVQAAPDFMGGGFIVAKRDNSDEVRQDKPPEGEKRRAPRREAEREEPQAYGHGYERRQQERFEEDSRPRGRR